MRFIPQDPPRKFTAGRTHPVTLRDCARILLEPDEQVTFVTEGGAEYDVARKAWGFYATPSLNGRLREFGWRSALVKSPGARLYLFLVEAGKEPEFLRYLEAEEHTVLCWLDRDEDVERLERGLGGRSAVRTKPAPLRCPCGEVHFSLAFEYSEPPKGEAQFQFNAGADYRREVLRCGLCGHFVSRCHMNAGILYDAQYVTANYADADGIRRTFDRITNLPEDKSDNAGRVRCILEFAHRYFGKEKRSSRPHSALDVGSGLCVFLYRMKAAGWDCTALDPDLRAVRHARDTVGVRAICGDFMTVTGLGEFDLVTFNKVLEHVEDPVGMLARAAAHVMADGFVYVEVPDGEAAAREGKHREEFFIDHLHVFSPVSLALLAERAGFALRSMERVREPSGKYTLRAFLVHRATLDHDQIQKEHLGHAPC